MGSVSSVAQSCPTLCDPMDCSTPSLPVLHQLLEFAQVHVPCIDDAVQPFHPLNGSSALFSFCSKSFLASGTFPMSCLFASGDQNTETSPSELPVKTQGWFLLRLTGLISLVKILCEVVQLGVVHSPPFSFSVIHFSVDSWIFSL